MPVRRLPNGRFARVVELPSPKRRPGPRSQGPVIIVRTNAAEAARRVGVQRLSVDPNLLRDSKDQAAFIQSKMQAVALQTYTRASTGRFARGIKANVSQSSVGDRSETIIKVTATNYRETRFLTSLGGLGYFRRYRYPVLPYLIWAKGAKKLADEVPIGVAVDSRKNFSRVARNERVGRLKVPRNQAFFTSEPSSTGGGEKRVINDALGPADPGDRKGAFFFYPIRVRHPGFARDVISDIAREEGAAYITYMMGSVGRSFSGSAQEASQMGMAVIDEIPLTRLRPTRATQSRGSRRFS